MTWLFTFVCIGALAGLYYYLRHRREQQRAAEEARAQAFLMEMHGRRGVERPLAEGVGGDQAVSPERPGPAPAPARDTVARPEADPHVPEPTPVATGPVYLERSHQVVWHWLKTALPAHEIFARGSLRRVVGKERTHKDMMLDFVICDEQLRVAAVIDLERARQDGAAVGVKRELLDAVGVRYACWSASQLPDKQFLRQWLQAPHRAPVRQDEIDR